MTNLIFLYNELMNPEVHNMLRLPLEFITFGIVDAKMYSGWNNEGNYVVPLTSNKKWGNDKVYGGIFLCKDIQFYIDILDAYHACSLNKLKVNHSMDTNHRYSIEVTPIYFKNLDDLSRLKYKEANKIQASIYFGNTNHPKITQKIHNTNSYRLVDGIDPINFKKLYMEVT